MKLIVGLGNPGSSYQATRHNIGRRVIETLARLDSRKLEKKSRLLSSLASLKWEGQSVTLAVPETFMNESGRPVKALVEHFSIDPSQDLLIVVDDVALPFGKLRLRPQGSDGGHNGLKSVEEFLQSDCYARLRIGIASERLSGQTLKDYVLSAFKPEEERGMASVLEAGGRACRLWTSASIAEAMNAVNTDETSS